MAKVHRAYRHKWWHPGKTITIRDQQAMWNFAQHVSLEAIAEHFRCPVELVSDAVMHRPWLQSRKMMSNLGEPGQKWWESDHSDPLYLVKLYNRAYLEYLPSKRVSPEMGSQEKHRQEVDWGAYFTQEYGADYALLSDETKFGLIQWAESVEEGYKPVLVFK